MSSDEPGGKGSPLTRDTTNPVFLHDWCPSFWGADRPVLGPAPVCDDDGLENVLVHVVGINGEWMWSDVLPEHYDMEEVQKIFHMSDPKRFGVSNDSHWYKLIWQYGTVGPYPPNHWKARYPLQPERKVFCLRKDLRMVNGLSRAEDTNEVWITAVRVPFI